MNTLSNIAQVIIAITIFIVWVIRYDNIVKEFKQYGISDLLRNFVGFSKIALATLLVTGIWYPTLVFIPAILMAGLMLCAQVAHIKVKNPPMKFVPSLILFALCVFIAFAHYDLFKI